MDRDDRMSELFDDLLRENRPMGQQREVIKPEISKLPSGVNEAINVLRGNVQLSGNNIKAVAVTSSVAHEGKSSIAFRLAKSMASLEKRVLVIFETLRHRFDIIFWEIKKDSVSIFVEKLLRRKLFITRMTRGWI